MRVGKPSCRVLVVSKTAKMTELLKEVLPSGNFTDMTWVKTAGEAKRLLLGTAYDIAVINTPLEDDFGIIAAIDINAQHDCGILLLVGSEMYEQVSCKTRDWGIFTLQKPVSRQMLTGTVAVMMTAQLKVHKMSAKITQLQRRMEEMSLIDRAKWILIDKLKMSEPQAHRYIEKQAMDRCMRRAEIAEYIIKMYEN